jgi:hypothetical protein
VYRFDIVDFLHKRGGEAESRRRSGSGKGQIVIHINQNQLKLNQNQHEKDNIINRSSSGSYYPGSFIFNKSQG